MHIVTKEADNGRAGQHPASPGLPHTALSRRIDRLIGAIGALASWLWLVLMAVIVAQVGLRYLLGQGSILLEELQWHIYGVGFLLALSFCLQADRHVRIDALAERFSLRTRSKIEIAGITLFLLPFCLSVILEGGLLAYQSWLLDEISAAPGGLPYRWVIKAAVPLGFTLLTIAALARLSRCTALLLGFPRPIR